MKKILGIIVLIVLIGLIGFGLTYKMVQPDGWDRSVDKVVEQVPALENIIPEKTPKPTPTPEGTAGNSQQNVSNPTATPTPTPTPAATQAPSVSPTPSATPEIEVDFENMTYEIYNNLPGETQEAFYETFAGPKEFFEWYNKAKEEYVDDNPTVEIGPDGSIDLGDYINSSSSNGN